MQGYKKQWNATLVILTNTAAGVKLWLLSPEPLRKGTKSLKHGP